MDRHLKRGIDWLLIAIAYAIASVGVLVLFSATHGDPTAFHKKQMIWIAIGTLGMVAATSIDFHLYQRFAKHLYVLNLVLLIIVLKFAPSINGAARWIRIGGFQFQPSEFAKLVVILTLAVFLTRRQETIRDLKTLALSFLYIAVPMVLINKQPDLGTALVILAIWFGMVYIAGARLKHLAVFMLSGLLLFSSLWYTGRLKDYQVKRIEALFDPEADPSGTGYHVLQARIAIGSGGMWGKGLLHSTQVRGGYIPEKESDFVFTTIGEEFGFVGGIVVTLLYAGLLWRGVMVVAHADEDFMGKSIAAGVVSMLAFHIVENIGMNIGIMPVAGVPLPLISAGGTNVILILTCLGLLQSVLRHRHQLLFR